MASTERSILWVDDEIDLLRPHILYLRGKGARRDPKEAAKWLERAANKGHLEAQYQLGRLFYLGTSLPRDFAQSAKWFRAAAMQGRPEAQFNLGLLYAAGQGVPSDDIRYVQAILERRLNSPLWKL